uniref:Glycylpeptide N-tetradecanoyltransferase n=1 Tax=Globodera pallida TaxID=36090 RepID=A0A183BKK9_GLOPA
MADDDKESEEQKKDDEESNEKNQRDAGKQQIATISAKKGKSKQKEVTNDAQPAQLNADMAADFARKIQIIQAASTSKAPQIPILGDTTYTKITENNYIDPPLDVSKVRKESYSLPEPFVWSDIDLNTNEQLDELALMPHGWRHQWHCGVRAGTSAKLLAFIAAVPATIRIYDQTIRVVEINFLCVHKKLRSKRLAPVLIKEVTRRVNLLGVFQATFTAGIIIPKPLYKLPENTESHLKPLNKDFVQGAFKLLSEYLTKFDLAPVFTVEEFEHFFLPRDDVIYTYVVEDSGTVTDLISFYSLPSTIMHHTHHKSIKAAYSFYNVAGSVPLIRLMNDALILARNLGFDVFNALDLMDNKGILEDLKFGIGDGNLQYYLYNWKCPDIAPDRIGLVLQ